MLCEELMLIVLEGRIWGYHNLKLETQVPFPSYLICIFKHWSNAPILICLAVMG